MDEHIEELKELLKLLSQPLESEDELFDLLDNFEVLASALAQVYLSAKVAAKAPDLSDVLERIGKAKKLPTLIKAGAELQEQTRQARKVAYGSWDGNDVDDVLSSANKLREQVLSTVQSLLNGAE